MAVNLHTTHYRFGIDELAESTHGWHANEDANPAQGTIAAGVTFLLRFTVQETGGTIASNTDQQFQVSKNGGAFQDITTSSTIVKAVAAAALTDGGNCTKRLSGTGTFESSGAGQTEDGLSGGNANDIAASGNSETECGLQIVATDVGSADVLTFRLTSPDFTITNDVVPTLTMAAVATGDLAVTETGDTFAATGKVVVQGTLGITESVDVPAASGTVLIQGDLAATDLVDTFAADGTVGSSEITGDLAVTESVDVAEMVGTVLVAGALAAADDVDIFESDGDVIVTGDLSVSELADILAATGTSGAPASSGPRKGARILMMGV